MKQQVQCIDATASIGRSVQIGELAVIGPGVTIGDDCEIGHGVVLHDGTRVGRGVRIDDHAVLGKRPMRAALSAVTREEDLPALEVGEGSIIGTNVVLYRGARIGSRVLVADLATVRERVTIGDRTIVGRGVSVENDCTIGRYVTLETDCYITAYSEIGDRVFVAPKVMTSNDRFIGRTEERLTQFTGISIARGGRIGVGAVILPGLSVGEDALVAAGSVVTRDVPARKIIMGTPARVIRDVAEEQLLDRQVWDDVCSGES